MKKTTSNHRENKTKIYRSFCELYRQKPLEKISIQEISNRSGYNRSTFYQYFTDIYELLDAVESNLLLDIKTELADKELSMHSVQDALSCLDKKNISMEQYLNLPQNHALTPYFIEFYLTTTLSLFRLWLQRDKDVPQKNSSS